jgi:hypothetical protein
MSGLSVFGFDLAAFVASGWAVTIALSVMSLQLALIAWLRRAIPGSGQALLSAAAPGAALMLALQAAVTGAGPIWVLVWLSVSYPLHLIDIGLRKK